MILFVLCFAFFRLLFSMSTTRSDLVQPILPATAANVPASSMNIPTFDADALNNAFMELMKELVPSDILESEMIDIRRYVSFYRNSNNTTTFQVAGDKQSSEIAAARTFLTKVLTTNRPLFDIMFFKYLFDVPLAQRILERNDKRVEELREQIQDRKEKIQKLELEKKINLAHYTLNLKGQHDNLLSYLERDQKLLTEAEEHQQWLKQMIEEKKKNQIAF